MADPAPSTLERRYRTLLRAYPARYRAERGEEILGTLLDLAGPDRRSPRISDAADLVASGLRYRLGMGTVAGLDGGLATAAPIALCVAAGISAFAWWRVEPVTPGVHIGGSALFGLFRTLGPVAYLAWLVAAAGWAVLRTGPARLLVGFAIAVTLTLPFVAPLTGVDRPPLWVLMALSAFGVLALGGYPRPLSTDERLAVPVGAVAVAITASAVMRAWPPSGGGFGYYYQPTISRVGTITASVVAAVAAVAVVRAVRGRSGSEWLWAAALLALPAGWLGPFDPAGLRGAADAAVPHFGRLAQVLLASCVAVAAMVWLARRSAPVGRAPVSRTGLAVAGSAAVGSAAGLGLAVAGLSTASGTPAPAHVVGTLAVVAASGLCALAVGGRPDLRLVAGAGVGAVVAAWLVGAYDNGWSATGWTDAARTASLMSTLALIPLSLCAVAAARAVPGRRAALLVLVPTLGWLGYATVPFVVSWGPVPPLLVACGAVVAFAGRRGRMGT
jgi:hypothetical protein